MSEGEVEIPYPSDLPFEHRASGLVFPPVVIAFKRTSIVAYDDDEVNVGVHYHIARAAAWLQQLVASVFVYPRSDTTGSPEADTLGHWEELLSALRLSHPEAVYREDVRSPVDRIVEARGGRGVIFSCLRTWGERGVLETEGQAYLFVSGRWYLKYRVSYPKKEWPYTEHHLAVLMDEIGMPQGA